MHFPSNITGQLFRFYQKELENHYDTEEVKALLYIIFEEYAGFKKAELLLNLDKPVSESALLKIHFAVKDLKNQKPVQYIIGKTSFYDLTFSLTPDVLIPRPETEELVKLVIDELYKQGVTNLKLLDIGTGSGCIPITIKKWFPNTEVYAFDNSEKALEVAKKNAETHHVDIYFSRIDILDKNNQSSLPDFDIIISNPPYVRESEKSLMNKNVFDYEPETALFVSDNNPLIFYNAIAELSENHLTKNGKVYLEINESLGKETAELFVSVGKVEILKDINGKDRFVLVRK